MLAHRQLTIDRQRSLALASIFNPTGVSDMLGHSAEAITLDIYSQELPAMQAYAAAVIGSSM